MSLRRHGYVMTFRMSHVERLQLKQAAMGAETTVSDVIREALYAAHGIGEFPAPSSLTPAPDALTITRGVRR
jgi:hypothetical protein